MKPVTLHGNDGFVYKISIFEQLVITNIETSHRNFKNKFKLKDSKEITTSKNCLPF